MMEPPEKEKAPSSHGVEDVFHRALTEIVLVKVAVGPPIPLLDFRPGDPRDYGTHATGDPPRRMYGLDALKNGTALKGVASGKNIAGSGNHGLEWAARVTLSGPQGNRGVGQIRAGFIQHVNIRLLRGQYERKTGETQDSWLAASIESPSRYYLDMMPDDPTRPPPGRLTTPPWYDRRYDARFFDATPEVNSKIISSWDDPVLGPPLTLEQRALGDLTDGWTERYHRLTKIALQAYFTLDVAAQTTDATNGANNFFWGQARGLWSFNGTGNVSGLDLTDPPNGIRWSGTGAGNTAPTGWSALTLAPEDVNPPVFNTLLPGVRYTPSSAPS